MNCLQLLWHCWLGVKKSIWPVKNWVTKCWRGYQSRVRCKWFACHCHPIMSCCIKIQIGLTFVVPAYPGRLGKEAIKWVPVFQCTWPKPKTKSIWTVNQIYSQLEMWANAQRDGRPAEHRWRPLFNAAKFGWRSLLDCRAVTIPRRETRWNYLGCPKLANRSQPLVGPSSQYCGDMWRTYCCLTGFFRLSICILVAKI